MLKCGDVGQHSENTRSRMNAPLRFCVLTINQTADRIFIRYCLWEYFATTLDVVLAAAPDAAKVVKRWSDLLQSRSPECGGSKRDQRCESADRSDLQRVRDKFASHKFE